MPVYKGDFFPKYADLSSLKYARKICGKYAKYAAELTLKRLLYQTVA